MPFLLIIALAVVFALLPPITSMLYIRLARKNYLHLLRTESFQPTLYPDWQHDIAIDESRHLLSFLDDGDVVVMAIGDIRHVQLKHLERPSMDFGLKEVIVVLGVMYLINRWPILIPIALIYVILNIPKPKNPQKSRLYVMTNERTFEIAFFSHDEAVEWLKLLTHASHASSTMTP